MNHRSYPFSSFIMLAVVIVALIFSAVLLSYLIYFGIIAAAIYYLINYLREKYQLHAVKKNAKQSTGRVFDSDEWHRLS